MDKLNEELGCKYDNQTKECLIILKEHLPEFSFYPSSDGTWTMTCAETQSQLTYEFILCGSPVMNFIRKELESFKNER